MGAKRLGLSIVFAVLAVGALAISAATAGAATLSATAAHEDDNGFVTDYQIVNGQDVSTGDMDSTDAYAGTFLLAVREAWRVDHNVTKLAGLSRGITGAVHAIEATQDADGLTWAKPSYHVKYLMDQAETWGGLVAANELAVTLIDVSLTSRAAADAAKQKVGIEGLWNVSTSSYDWAVHSDGTRVATNWNNFYPDATEQAAVVTFFVTDQVRATLLMTQLRAAHPTWDQPTSVDQIDGAPAAIGYWPMVGLGVADSGDLVSAAAGGQHIRDAALATGRSWPYTPAAAGELVLLLTGGWR